MWILSYDERRVCRRQEGAFSFHPQKGSTLSVTFSSLFIHSFKKYLLCTYYIQVVAWVPKKKIKLHKQRSKNSSFSSSSFSRSNHQHWWEVSAPYQRVWILPPTPLPSSQPPSPPACRMAMLPNWPAHFHSGSPTAYTLQQKPVSFENTNLFMSHMPLLSR